MSGRTPSPRSRATAAVDGLTVDYAQQAAGSAQSYIDMSGFSRSELVDQLVYEGYTPDQAESGVSSLSVDYSEQARRSTQSYLDLMPMSRAELVDQLIYEGYTPEEAAAGADSAGL
ncbi:MAG: Ltp family lipoprotein [Micrococcales bacterium]|nr:Ltp family lipoprotein [Micrococcales bacterium]